MSALPLARLTPEEYLAIDRAAEVRSEYYNGQMYAIPGGTKRHARITLNCVAPLEAAARLLGCQIFATDVRVQVSSEGPYFYPDVVVECGEAAKQSGEDIVTSPVLVLEVLSPSTEDFDRGRKFLSYMKLPSLKEYVLVSQTEPGVTAHRRTARNTWEMEQITDPAATLRLDSLHADLPLAAIYADVNFG
jgi:Uma2 family endonuclease